MSSPEQPSWIHPLLRLHHRYVEKRVSAAEAAAKELGVDLKGEAIRQALAYDRRQFASMALRMTALVSVLALALVAATHGACTPGGTLEPTPDTDCSLSKYSWWVPLLAMNIFMLALLGLLWFADAIRGQTTARCSRPLHPLLALLTCTAATSRPDVTYTQAIKLSQKVSRLRLPLRVLARTAAEDFGKRRALRTELVRHLGRVDSAFIEAANQLAGDREASARRIGELAAHAANNIACGRFTAVLPPEVLAEDPPLEPDQLDGRRLGTSCLWAAIIVACTFTVLSPLGVPAELLVPVALIAFLVVVYALLAFRYGLSEATRLTRSIGGFFSAGPPL
ncbi:hypothetical protein [Streptomyces griseorubiginosus]|uniref:hypothetical protein n=1 Tax=Streptomyces griseorubiginosus TaxID=67304 RepID=UPI0011407885|nr:hypothetical protein [Streptomyces griseorubiginosus]